MRVARPAQPSRAQAEVDGMRRKNAISRFTTLVFATLACLADCRARTAVAEPARGRRAVLGLLCDGLAPRHARDLDAGAPERCSRPDAQSWHPLRRRQRSRRHTHLPLRPRRTGVLSQRLGSAHECRKPREQPGGRGLRRHRAAAGGTAGGDGLRRAHAASRHAARDDGRRQHGNDQRHRGGADRAPQGPGDCTRHLLRPRAAARLRRGAAGAHRESSTLALADQASA